MVNKIEEKIKEFSAIADEWLTSSDFLEKRYLYFREFFKTENLDKAEWTDFQNMGSNLHAFNTAIAKANALGRMNLSSIDEYRKIFKYMVSEKDPINVTINKLREKGSGFYLPYFGNSSLSELISYAFPEKYVFYNERDKKALNYLGLSLDPVRNEKFGDTFLRYNNLITEVIKSYNDHVKQRTKTTICLEVDQFFSWLYENLSKGGVINEEIDYYCVGFNWKEEGDKLKQFVNDGIWQNGYEKEYADIVNNVKFGSLLAAKTSFTKKKGKKTISILKIHAIGVVTNNLKDGKNLKVTWNNEFEPFEIEGAGGYRTTIDKVSKKKYIDLIFKNKNVKLDKIILLKPDKVEEKNRYQILNKILYGPPGTGKTFHTLNRALEIIEHKSKDELEIEPREEIKKRYNEYVRSEQIVFTTFHQSYGYEEFVEGIKASTDENSDNQKIVTYEVEPGVFRKLCKSAEDNYKLSKKEVIKINFETVFNRLFSEIDLEKETKIKINTKNSFFLIKEVSERGTIRFDKKSGTSNHTLSKKTLQKMYEQGKNNIITGGLQVYYESILERLFDLSKLLQKEQKYESIKNYVLIIDEINRGNISKIFGELITLIEDSKRIGNPEELKVKLPYSGDEFGVPNNLYIIGTMNTADRSIALMDTALRRRFQFEEMMPNLDLLKVKDKDEKDLDLKVDGINIRLMLQKINERIEYLYDRDHTIGHSYFLPLKDYKDNQKEEAKKKLDDIFRTNIIPLLQEYFYDDWEKLQIVLGDHFKQFEKYKELLKADKNENLLKTNEDEDFKDGPKNKYRFIQSQKSVEMKVIGFKHDDIEDDKTEYRINKEFKTEAYKKIYE